LPLLARYFGLNDSERIRSTLTWAELEKFKAYARLFAKIDGLDLTL